MIQAIRPADEETISLCCVRVGEEVFGIETLDVQEVLGESDVHKVPLTHEFVGGMMPYRGEVLTVMCSRSLLGLPPLVGAASVLVLRDEQEDELFGFAVDEVADVLSVRPSSFEENPCTLDARRKLIFAGAYKLQEGVIVRLEPALLRPAKLAELHQMSDGK